MLTAMPPKKKSKSSSAKTIVVVGAALAGPTAAARAREVDEHARIILLERNTRVSYAMTGLSLHLSGEVTSLEELNREREDFFQSVYNIEVRTRTEVIQLDAKKKLLHLRDQKGDSTLPYDRLILASGASSLHPIGLKPAENFRYFRTLDDLAAIRAQLDSGARRFVILGGGSMGAEALDGLVRGGADVTLVEKKLRFLPDYAPEISAIATAAQEHKARIVAGFKHTDFEYKDNRIVAVKVDGMRIDTDFVVGAIGVRPRTELLKKAGVRLLGDGSIAVNERCETNVKDIYACSICVSVPDGKEHVYIPQAAVSDKTAQVAGENAAGGKAVLRSMTASQIIRLPGIEIGRVGLTCSQAMRKFGKTNIGSVFVHGRNTEPYMPGSEGISLKLFYHRKKKQVIALEAAGKDIKSRLDTVAAALAGGLTLNQLAMLDLAYTPAYGTARDALNVAATVALQKEAGLTATTSYEEIRAARAKYFVVDVSLKARHAGFHDMHIPLERLRESTGQLAEKFKKSRAKIVATLSESGRRGHLAMRILKARGFTAVNILGGKKNS